MKTSIVREKMRRGEPILTAKINFMNPDMAEMIGYAGYDVLWICNEHAYVDPDMLKNILRTAKITGIDMMVRTSYGKGDYTDLIQPLEAGAQGLMIPRIQDREQLEFIVRECKFHPLWLRGVDAVNQDADQGYASMLDYMKFANDNTFIVAQIEDPAALEKAEDLASVKGVDVLFLGPADFCHSIGKPGQFRCPEVGAAIDKLTAICQKHNIYCGTVGFGDPEFCRQLIDRGVKFLGGPSDWNICYNGFKADVEKYRKNGLFTFREYGK